MNGETQRSRILDVLKRKGSALTDELVDAVGLSKTAVRMHLVQLEEEGAVTRTSEKVQGRGRPPARYYLTASGNRRFPTHDGAVLKELLLFLKHRNENEIIEQFFRQLWSKRRTSFQGKVDAKPLTRKATLEEKLSALQDLLEETDFMPRISRRGNRVQVCECNCPIPFAARSSRVPCKLEAEFIAEVIGGTLVSANFATGATTTCHFEVEVDL